MGVDFSEYSFMNIPHYLSETLRKAERNNGFFVSAEAEKEKLYEICIFFISTRQSFIQQRQQEIKK